MRPSGENATDRTLAVWPVRGEPRELGVDRSTSHSRTVLSSLALARVRPSGENATEFTSPVLPPVSGPPSGLGATGSETLHNRTVLSQLALARIWPSGENATDSTSLV